MLRGERVILRPLERGDLPQCHQWLNDEEVTTYLGMNDPLPMAAEENWFEEQLKDESRINFAVENEEGRHIGNGGLYNIDYRHGTATVGVLIGEKDAWGQGYGPEITLVLLGYAFEDLRLYRIAARAFAINPRATRSLEKCGFVQEGVMRGAIFRFGEHQDLILFSITRDEFYERGG